MRPKMLRIKGLRVPTLVVSLAKQGGRTYVSPRFRPEGGAAVTDRLTAMDIEKQVFRRKVRGFDPEEVQYYLKSVAEEVERLNLQNAELREEVGALRRQAEELRAREKLLQQTLVTAQKMTDELKDRSRSEADQIIREARMKSERLLQDAQDQLSRLEAEISRCKIEKDLFEKRLRASIDEHLSLLDRRREEGDGFENVRVLHRRSGTEAG